MDDQDKEFENEFRKNWEIMGRDIFANMKMSEVKISSSVIKNIFIEIFFEALEKMTEENLWKYESKE